MYEKQKKRKGPQVLIVDDHLENLNLIQLHLTAHDYNVEIAVNGYDALKKLEQQRFDLIVTDISMPGMGGNELCQTIRESCGGETLPIIAMSAEPWLATADFGHVITKPFRMNHVEKVIRETLGKTGKVIPLRERTGQP